MSNTAAVLLVPHLQVQNANSISGPFTWGFPSPTAFTGFVHALERRLSKEFDLEFGGIGIVCHHFEPQISQPANRRHQVFCLTRNPLNRSGATAALVEEARAHMEISLVIEVLTELDDEDQTELTERLLTTIHSMRLAGGSILPRYSKRHQPEWFGWWDDEADNITAFRKLRHHLLPGFALIQREDLLVEHLQEMRTQNAESTVLDALMDLSRLNMEPSGPDPKKPSETLWRARSKPGWLVPVPVGYAALSPLYSSGEVTNARDEVTPFRFVESLYSLGQWISPHRLTELNQLLWRHEADIETGIYRCTNQYANTLNNA